jgi:hypothetical protein
MQIADCPIDSDGMQEFGINGTIITQCDVVDLHKGP